MPERLHPGVYVEEVSGGVRPIEGVSTSTAAFIGEAPRGIPGLAQFLTSFADFEKAFGGHVSGNRGLLAQAVDAFFSAGGRRTYVVRVLPSDAERGASQTVNARGADVGGGVPRALSFRARGAGVWSTHLRINLTQATHFPDESFRVEVLWTEAGTTRQLEVFDDVRMDPTHEDYVLERINGISRYVEVVDQLALQLDSLASGTTLLPAQPPVLRAAAPTGSGNTYTLYDGTRLQLSAWDTAAPDTPRITSTVTITPGFVNTAVGAGAPSFTNGRVQLTADQLDAVLTSGVTPTGGQPRFAISVTGGRVEIRPHVARPPSFTIAAPGASGTHDLSGQTVRVTHGPTGATTTEPVALSGVADVSAVTPTELRDALIAAIGTDVQSVQLQPDGSIIVTGVNTATGGTTVSLAVSPAADRLATTTVAAAGGALPERFDGLRLSISEELRPNVPPSLRQLGFPPRSRGYLANSRAHPDARPAVTSSLRLLGGTDGANTISSSDFTGTSSSRTGLHALDGIEVNLVALPGKNEAAYISAGIAYCDRRGDCFFLADGPGGVDRNFVIGPADARQFIEGLPSRSQNAAMFYPWIRVPDPVGVGRNPTRMAPPSGYMAGIFARTDVARGVWKAPAGIEATVPQALGLQYDVVDEEQDILNPVSLNCLRQFPGTGIVSWGTRTLGADPEWRYIPVRRTALFLKESLRRGLRWAVFEPNDEELWGRIRINIEAFMLGLFRQGAFQGTTPDEAFRVVCDRSTNPQENVDAGIVTARVAFAPLKPAEFVVIEISQKSLLVS